MWLSKKRWSDYIYTPFTMKLVHIWGYFTKGSINMQIQIFSNTFVSPQLGYTSAVWKPYKATAVCEFVSVQSLRSECARKSWINDVNFLELFQHQPIHEWILHAPHDLCTVFKIMYVMVRIYSVLAKTVVELPTTTFAQNSHLNIFCLIY